MKHTGTKPTKAKPPKQTVTSRLPPQFVRKLDAACKRSGRSRDAEVRLRLEESLARCPVLAGLAGD